MLMQQFLFLMNEIKAEIVLQIQFGFGLIDCTFNSGRERIERNAISSVYLAMQLKLKLMLKLKLKLKLRDTLNRLIIYVNCFPIFALTTATSCWTQIKVYPKMGKQWGR